MNHLQEGFDDRVLVDGLSFKLPPDGIVVIICPTGSGKTTLSPILVGQQHDGGTTKRVETIELAYVDQSRQAATHWR